MTGVSTEPGEGQVIYDEVGGDVEGEVSEETTSDYTYPKVGEKRDDFIFKKNVAYGANRMVLAM